MISDESFKNDSCIVIGQLPNNCDTLNVDTVIMRFAKSYQTLPIAAKESCEIITQLLSLQPDFGILLDMLVTVCVFESDDIVALHSIRMDAVDERVVVTMIEINFTIMFIRLVLPTHLSHRYSINPMAF